MVIMPQKFIHFPVVRFARFAGINDLDVVENP